MTSQIQNIDITDERVLIVGPIYNRTDKLVALNQLCKSNDILVFLGDVCYPYKNTREVVKRINELVGFFENKRAYYLLGNYDLIFKSQVASSNTDAWDWLHKQLLGVRFTYKNNTNLLVIHGGILPKHKKMTDLNNDPEISFVSETEEKIDWHKKYDGRFGYVISAHPTSLKEEPNIYKYSVSLDTQCHLKKNDKLLVQEFTKNGLGETFFI